ncbi:MAG: hypothetical protein GY810_32065 [Aureispira sp.]|nr:hypothetical protein [Aureispira sp.]
MKKYYQKGLLFLVALLSVNGAFAQDLHLEKYAESGGTFFWIWVVVVSFIALLLFASLLFSKKKEYSK